MIKKNWRIGTFNVCMLHCPFRGELSEAAVFLTWTSHVYLPVLLKKIGETAASLTSGKEQLSVLN